MTTIESNARLLATLEPKGLWEIFGLLLATPRESGHEERVRAKLIELADAQGTTRCHRSRTVLRPKPHLIKMGFSFF
jgi:hypothetical protein